MNRKLEETEILLCRCHSSEHQILVHYNENDADKLQAMADALRTIKQKSYKR